MCWNNDVHFHHYFVSHPTVCFLSLKTLFSLSLTTYIVLYSVIVFCAYLSDFYIKWENAVYLNTQHSALSFVNIEKGLNLDAKAIGWFLAILESEKSLVNMLTAFSKQFLAEQVKIKFFFCKVSGHSGCLNFKNCWENSLNGGKFVRSGAIHISRFVYSLST